MAKRVAVLLVDGFEEMEAICPIDILRRAAIEVKTLGVSGKLVTGKHGLRVEADATLKENEALFDCVLIPGGPGANAIAKSKTAMDFIKRHALEDLLIAAICAAPAVVLYPAGLLKGKRFTCFPGMESQVFGARFSEDRVVVDGKIITSRAAGTSMEFALVVAEALVGKDTARKVSASALIA